MSGDKFVSVLVAGAFFGWMLYSILAYIRIFVSSLPMENPRRRTALAHAYGGLFLIIVLQVSAWIGWHTDYMMVSRHGIMPKIAITAPSALLLFGICNNALMELRHRWAFRMIPRGRAATQMIGIWMFVAVCCVIAGMQAHAAARQSPFPSNEYALFMVLHLCFEISFLLLYARTVKFSGSNLAPAHLVRAGRIKEYAVGWAIAGVGAALIYPPTF